jgi:hypothetical protein
MLILVHDDIESPVQAVFDPPSDSERPVSSGREHRTQQVISGLGRGFGGDFAGADQLADGGQRGH